LNSSNAGFELIKKSEGLRLETYKDVAGFATTGYGHKLTDGRRFGMAAMPVGLSGSLRQPACRRLCDANIQADSNRFKFVMDRVSSSDHWTVLNIGKRKCLAHKDRPMSNASMFDRFCRQSISVVLADAFQFSMLLR
jgi:hypothetical protein